MSKHLQRDLERIERGILTIGSLVESAINKAILALEQQRIDLAQQVLRDDDEIDRREVELEEDCLKMLALHQPVAADLRYIVTVLKVNSVLERMADVAINVAQRAINLDNKPPLARPVDYETITNSVQRMVRMCLDALVKWDAVLARGVIELDDRVDRANEQIADHIMEQIRTDPNMVYTGIQSLLASRHLERIADLACGIAEDVVFMADGEIIRHRLGMNGHRRVHIEDRE